MSASSRASSNGHHAGALGDGARLAVRAGRPTPEELAALVIALDLHGSGRRATAADTRAAQPAWQRAARWEGAGLGPLATRGDVERLDRHRPRR